MTEQHFIAVILVGGVLILWVKLLDIQAQMKRMELQLKFSVAQQLVDIEALLDRPMPVNEVSVSLAVNKLDGAVVVSRDVSISSEELTSVQVEHWLASRNLVMQPRAVDFKFQTPVTGNQPTNQVKP